MQRCRCAREPGNYHHARSGGEARAVHPGSSCGLGSWSALCSFASERPQLPRRQLPARHALLVLRRISRCVGGGRRRQSDPACGAGSPAVLPPSTRAFVYTDVLQAFNSCNLRNSKRLSVGVSGRSKLYRAYSTLTINARWTGIGSRSQLAGSRRHRRSSIERTRWRGAWVAPHEHAGLCGQQ